MKNLKIGFGVVVLIFSLLGVSNAIGGSTDQNKGPIRFGVCFSNMAEVEVVKEGERGEGKTLLLISFNKEGVRQLGTLTGKYYGKVIEFMYDGVVLLRDLIRDPTPGRAMLSFKWSSEDAAEEMAKLLRNKFLKVPCGRIRE